MNSVILCVLIFVSALGLPPRPGSALQSETAGSRGLVILRGRIECFDMSGKRLDSFSAIAGPEARYALMDGNGELHPFSSTDPETAVFSDLRVRQRELQVSARADKGNRLEVIKVQSVRDGKLYDIYYYCELCNIKAYAPGLCPCCRNEMEFRETPS